MHPPAPVLGMAVGVNVQRAALGAVAVDVAASLPRVGRGQRAAQAHRLVVAAGALPAGPLGGGDQVEPEFARKALENALHGAGIRYVYMGNVLGGQPDDRSCYDAAGKVLYDRVQETAAYRQGIDRVRKAFDQGLRVALMCSEGKPELCHRSKLIGETLARLGLPVQHIDENDALESQEAVRDRLTAGQLSLWDDYGFTSRKRYNEEAEDA